MQAGLISPSLVFCPSATRLHAELIQKCVFAFVCALSYAATLCASVSSSRGTAERRWWRVLGTVKPTSSTIIGPWWGSSSTRTSTPSVQVRDIAPPPPRFCSAVVFLWPSRHSSSFRLMRWSATRDFPTVDLNLQLCPTSNTSFSSLLNVTHLKTSRWGVFGFHVNSHISSVLMVSLRQRE